MEFLIDRVRYNLHLVLCCSPVGSTLRQRSRKFPTLVNCCTIDWFHPWEKSALVSVAIKFLCKVRTCANLKKKNKNKKIKTRISIVLI